MILTRIPLDTRRRNTMRALASPNLIHGAIESCFEGERKRRLWRIDTLNGCCYLLLLSEDQPDLSSFEKQFGFAEKHPSWESKNYDRLLERIENDSCWHFRLTANPIVQRKNNQEGERSRIFAHTTVDYQKQWLMSRAESRGFLLSEDDFTVVSRQWFHFYHGSKKQRISLLSVTYEGMLQVSDKDLFAETLINGIGREKAYGMGLLTIAR